MSLVQDSSVSVDAYWASKPGDEFVGSMRSDQLKPAFNKFKDTSEAVITFKVRHETFDQSGKRLDDPIIEKAYLLKQVDNEITFHDIAPSSATADDPFKAGASAVVNEKFKVWQTHTKKTAQLLHDEPELGSRFMKLASEEVLRLSQCLALYLHEHVRYSPWIEPVKLEPAQVRSYQNQLKTLSSQLWSCDVKVDIDWINASADLLPEAIEIFLSALFELPQRQQTALAEVQKMLLKLTHTMNLSDESADDAIPTRLNKLIESCKQTEKKVEKVYSQHAQNTFKKR
ncbi:hypothetical protein D5018_18510 [Parashewanella curva]|uniref:Uncharacterized protein n=1 Tax=Parashewanella curva TaxID=2338552 RepID=A0A3L8PS43_9GAMM|nr:hypothetical protein [Parashewanella curva]RLV58215.1 hypothetical protein D5018_18510 [Parashewanella curva]